MTEISTGRQELLAGAGSVAAFIAGDAYTAALQSMSGPLADNVTADYGLVLKREKFDLEHDRNHNVMVIGGPGSGKTRYYAEPNLMQLNSCYFVTDPKGAVLQEGA